MCNYFCTGKAVSTTHYEFMFVASDIQRAMGMHRVVICSLSSSTVLFHMLSSAACPALQYCSICCHLPPVQLYSTVPNVVICSLSSSTVLFHMLSSAACPALQYCSICCHLPPVQLYSTVPYVVICRLSSFTVLFHMLSSAA